MCIHTMLNLPAIFYVLWDLTNCKQSNVETISVPIVEDKMMKEYGSLQFG